MSIDSRIALAALVSAFEEHLTKAEQRAFDGDPAVEKSYIAIAEAFEQYEESLFTQHNEVTPLVIFEDEESFPEGDDEEEEYEPLDLNL